MLVQYGGASAQRNDISYPSPMLTIKVGLTKIQVSKPLPWGDPELLVPWAEAHTWALSALPSVFLRYSQGTSLCGTPPLQNIHMISYTRLINSEMC